ncbi:MAG: YdcF family protein [Cyanobacteria bacterium P01_F01_bin.33]
MFFAASKLLPLLIYPLGLACLLLGLSLAIFWRFPRVAAASVALALTVLLLAGNGWVASALVRSLEWQYLPPDEVPQAEAIVVLGGGTGAPDYPRPWVDLNDAGDRVVYGAKLFQEGKAPWLILSGGRVVWMSGQMPEADDMSAIATAMGVPLTAILPEPNSHNTYENAINVRQILQERNIGRILLVTSAMHMPRSLAIFRHLGMDAVPIPTDYWVTDADIEPSLAGFLLGCLPDAENLRQTSRALKEYIGTAVYRLKGWL